MSLRLLVVGEAAAAAARAAGLEVTTTAAADSAGDAAGGSADFAGHDAVLFSATGGQAPAGLARAAAACAALVLVDADDERLEAELLGAGAQAVVPAGDGPALVRALRQAVLRWRVERALRLAYATDLATGLPHEAQLLEHMTQLLALREREPAPLALLALRIEGIAAARARLGDEAANVLRRKVAVRLRGGLRASDVVASIGPDLFGVLLGHLEAAGDSERVAAKLVRALQQPFVVAGQPCTVAAVVGLSLSPQHGKDGKALLQRAVAQAAGVGAAGQGLVLQSPRAGGGAANDEG